MTESSSEDPEVQRWAPSNGIGELGDRHRVEGVAGNWVAGQFDPWRERTKPGLLITHKAARSTGKAGTDESKLKEEGTK